MSSDMTHSIERREAGIVRTAEQKVYQNAFVTVFDDDVRFSDGQSGHYVRVVEAEGRPGVAMLAVCGEQVALVRTYRYTLQCWEWGIPRGFGQDCDPAQSARAELVEELGAHPEQLDLLTTMTPNSGILATSVSVFLAHYSDTPTLPLDLREVSAVRWLSWRQLLDEVAAGQITDGFTLAAVGIALARGIVTCKGRGIKKPK